MQTSVIYGRSLEDHLFDCVSAINREICSGSVQPELLIQGLGMNINKTLAISEMLENILLARWWKSRSEVLR